MREKNKKRNGNVPPCTYVKKKKQEDNSFFLRFRRRNVGIGQKVNVSYYRLTARESEPAATGWARNFFFLFEKVVGRGFHVPHKQLYRHLQHS